VKILKSQSFLLTILSDSATTLTSENSYYLLPIHYMLHITYTYRVNISRIILPASVLGVAGMNARMEGGMGQAPAPGRRKPCNCKNSKCLKLYCECFAAGVYCEVCLCLCNVYTYMFM
jgi:hypothetical protein